MKLPSDIADIHICDLFSVQRLIYVSAKKFGTGQPAQSAQADLCRFFFFFFFFFVISQFSVNQKTILSHANWLLNLEVK